MSKDKIITMAHVRAEQCDDEIQTVLDKYNCTLVMEQRVINGVPHRKPDLLRSAGTGRAG